MYSSLDQLVFSTSSMPYSLSFGGQQSHKTLQKMCLLRVLSIYQHPFLQQGALQQQSPLVLKACFSKFCTGTHNFLAYVMGCCKHRYKRCNLYSMDEDRNEFFEEADTDEPRYETTQEQTLQCNLENRCFMTNKINSR